MDFSSKILFTPVRQLAWTISTLLSKQINLKKSMGGDWQRPRLMLYLYIICVCVHSGLSTPEHNIVKSKLYFFVPQNKKNHSVHEWHYFVRLGSIHVWLMMCFLIFCNHRPNTKQIFQFTEGVVGKLESKTWKNAEKNSISVSKTWGKHR